MLEVFDVGEGGSGKQGEGEWAEPHMNIGGGSFGAVLTALWHGGCIVVDDAVVCIILKKKTFLCDWGVVR